MPVSGNQAAMPAREQVSSDAESLALVAVVGSVTPPGRLRRAVELALERALAEGSLTATLIDLADVRIAFADGRPPQELGDDTASVLAQIDAADAVLLATPVYRGSLTGALKNLLDHVPVDALEGKAVAILAMGATQHHYLGAERHLRDTLAFYGSVVAPVAAYLTAADFRDGEPEQRATDELDALLSDLLALARALAVRPAAQSLRPLAGRRPPRP